MLMAASCSAGEVPETQRPDALVVRTNAMSVGFSAKCATTDSNSCDQTMLSVLCDRLHRHAAARLSMGRHAPRLVA